MLKFFNKAHNIYKRNAFLFQTILYTSLCFIIHHCRFLKLFKSIFVTMIDFFYAEGFLLNNSVFMENILWRKYFVSGLTKDENSMSEKEEKSFWFIFFFQSFLFIYSQHYLNIFDTNSIGAPSLNIDRATLSAAKYHSWLEFFLAKNLTNF